MSFVTNLTFGAIGAAIIVAMVLGENITRREEPKDKVVVTYWEKWSGFEADAMRVVVDKFNKSQDKIFVNFLSVSGIKQKTLLATAGGIPPDISGLDGSSVSQMAVANAMITMDDLLKENGISRDQYVPVYWDMCEFEGNMYGLPSTPATTALHYNIDQFKDAGLDPNKPPQTIEELDAMSDKLTIKEGGKIKRAGFLPAEPGWWKERFGSVFGAEYWDEKEGKITANSKENIEAYEWVRKYSEKYGAQASSEFQSGFGKFATPQNPFLDGKVSTVLQGVWMYNFISKYKSDLKWAAAPFPHPANRPDLANMTYADTDLLIIPRGAKHPKEAFEFIKFLQQRENMELLCLGQQKQTPLASVSDEFWQKSKNPYLKLFYDLGKSKNAVLPPKIAIWGEYSAELGVAFTKIAQNPKEKDVVKNALDYVTERMQPKLDRELKIRKARAEKK